MSGLRKVRYSGICFYEHESHADAGILAVDGVCFVFCNLKSLIEAAFFLTIKTKACEFTTLQLRYRAGLSRLTVASSAFPRVASTITNSSVRSNRGILIFSRKREDEATFKRVF